MLQVQNQQKGDLQVWYFKGSIDETTDFAHDIGEINGQRVDVILKEVVRINSQGAKSWIKFFQGVEGKGITIRFLECSTAVVEWINNISNFVSFGVLESIYLPFYCRDCNKEFLGLFRVADVKKIQSKVPDLACPNCQGSSSFDDVEKEYLYFLTRGDK